MSPAVATGLWAAALGAGLVALVRLGARPLVPVAAPAAAASPSAGAPVEASAAPDSSGAAIIARDPFRLARRTAPLAYDPLRAGQPPAAPPPKPVLALDGIVWDGAGSPTALVEGFPGAGGARVVRTGDVVTGLRIRDIRRDRVVIAGLDTVWTLTVKEPWR